jgi:5'-3' exonuclease
MQVHLIDGTYELFRCFFGAPSAKTAGGREVGATRALLRSFASWLRTGEVTHVACAFDHVIESFRNGLFDGYKTGEGIDPDLYSQFELAERATAALGITVWPMVEFEADDAIAAGAVKFAREKGVTQVLMCSPDKDLAQCVQGNKIVAFDRQRQILLDEAGVVAKFGVPPASIPDLLALVGDTADGIPGVDRWGMKGAAAVLAAYGTVEAIPTDAAQWTVKVRGAAALAETLATSKKAALLYKKLATLRTDVPLTETLADIEYLGAEQAALAAICEEIEERSLMERITRWRP